MKKIKVLELDLTTIYETFTVNSAGIWQKTMSVPLSVQALSPITTIFSGTWEIGIDPIAIGSVRVENNLLGDVGTIEELYIQDGAFYFDVPTQVLYLALFDYTPAWGYKTYKVGETSGFISEAQSQLINGRLYPVSSRLGATFYEPRLQGDIDIPESVDDQTNGIFVYKDLTATLINGDGAYDNIRTDVTGNEARILIAHISESPEEEAETGIPYKQRAEASDFEIVREGVVEDVDYSNPNFPVVRAIDPRADWTQTIGNTFMTVDDYPDLESSNINKRKPIIIGNVQGTKCIRLEPKPASSASVDFLVCDTSIGSIDLVDDIYFEGKISGSDVDRYLTAGEYSINTVTGILTVNNYDSGNAFFYGRVTEMVETVEIILFLLTEYAGLAYIASNYNQNEIEIIRALNYTTHVYIDKGGKDLSKVIDKLVSDIKIDFFQQGSVLTMRKGNTQRPSVENIPYWQLSDNPVPWVNDRTDTVKTIAIGYNVDYRLDTFDTYYDNSKEQEARDNNQKAVDFTEETNLTTVSDVADIYDEYYSRFTVSSRTVIINRKQPFTAKLTDFVTLSVSRIRQGIETKVFERGLYKIISIDQNEDTAEAVYFSDSPEPYLSPGLAAFATPAFGAPTVVSVFNPYPGNPAFTAAAFALPVEPGGSIEIQNPVNGSGYVAGINQQIGE